MSHPCNLTRTRPWVAAVLLIATFVCSYEIPLRSLEGGCFAAPVEAQAASLSLLQHRSRKQEAVPVSEHELDEVKEADAVASRQLETVRRMSEDDRKATCTTVVFSNVFSGRKDWQRGRHIKPGVDYFKRFHDSILSVPGVRVVLFYDELPSNLTEQYSTANFRFVHVDLSTFDRHLGVNDVRFLVFQKYLQEHPEFETVFTTDIADVVVRHNPCTLVAKWPHKLFVGSETNALAGNVWMKDRFRSMGGQYMEWFSKQTNKTEVIFNAGIIGGRRGAILEFLAKLTTTLSDPTLAARRTGDEVDVNMAALNWLLRSEYPSDQVVSGEPLHSIYKGHEERKDVFFTHKF